MIPIGSSLSASSIVSWGKRESVSPSYLRGNTIFQIKNMTFFNK